MKPFEKLNNYIANEMRMSHIYQPVMLRELLIRNGSATVEEIARALLSFDESQVEYYSVRTKNMVGKVLTSNGITTAAKKGRVISGYDLIGAAVLEPEERDILVNTCDRKIADYVGKRGEKIWSHRMNSAGYVSGTLRYEILKRAKFRCELCGISAEQKALEVDHILPRNLGGSDDEANLQALCYSCNAMKRDRDDTDFRNMADEYHNRQEGCLFCDTSLDRIIAEDELCIAIEDRYPATPGHMLIIPKRHVADYFDLFQPELNAINRMAQAMRERIQNSDTSVEGFNFGINSGAVAGQTIFHCHIHLIPRRKGDVESPRGGVRGVIPDKQSY